MKRIETIKKQVEFNKIIKEGKFQKNNYFVIYFLPSTEENPKYGIAISNKYGKANERNKIKRQTRTIIDKYRKLFKNYNNYIIMIRTKCKEISFKDKELYLKELIEKW